MPVQTNKKAPTPGRTTRPAAAPKPTARKGAKAEIRIFISYAHADAAARDRLDKHLAELKRDGVTTWYDGDMNAGDTLEIGIARELRRAHIFVALLSPDYLASNYCWNIEFSRAMNRRARGSMRVIALVLRPCDWKPSRAARFKLLPQDARPVTNWRSADEAFLNIAEGIRAVVQTLRKELQASKGRQNLTLPAAMRPTMPRKPPRPTPKKPGGRKTKPAKPRQ